MLILDLQNRHAGQRRPITNLAHSDAEILEAQRLRYKVFAKEMGANLTSASEGGDRDMFDKYCKHLLMRENGGNKIGGYNVIMPINRLRQ